MQKYWGWKEGTKERWIDEREVRRKKRRDGWMEEKEGWKKRMDGRMTSRKRCKQQGTVDKSEKIKIYGDEELHYTRNYGKRKM